MKGQLVTRATYICLFMSMVMFAIAFILAASEARALPLAEASATEAATQPGTESEALQLPPVPPDDQSYTGGLTWAPENGLTRLYENMDDGAEDGQEEVPADEPEDGGEKLIALTFDDGPGPYTDQLLDELAARDVKVTFYLLGNCVELYPDTTARIAAEGHEIGSHTYSHPYLTKLSKTDVLSELNQTSELIAEAAGVTPSSLRPPGGFYNLTVRNVAADLGLPIVLWSVDTEDWLSRDVDTILDNMLNGEDRVRDGDIILMHDIYDTSVEAAIAAIDQLLDEGYTFVTVSELLQERSGGAEPGEVYRNGR